MWGRHLRSAIVGDARAALFVMATIVGLLLFAAMVDIVGLVLILALTVVYGALAAWLRYRSAELAVRAAMGATPRDLCRLVARPGSVLTGVGVIIAMPFIRLGASPLARLQPTFPEVATSASLATLCVVVAVRAAATMILARRAARTNITDTLRNDWTTSPDRRVRCRRRPSRDTFSAAPSPVRAAPRPSRY
jgi:ABC-type antimicrobial peptide transport system permease subunit